MLKNEEKWRKMEKNIGKLWKNVEIYGYGKMSIIGLGSAH